MKLELQCTFNYMYLIFIIFFCNFFYSADKFNSKYHYSVKGNQHLMFRHRGNFYMLLMLWKWFPIRSLFSIGCLAHSTTLIYLNFLFPVSFLPKTQGNPICPVREYLWNQPRFPGRRNGLWVDVRDETSQRRTGGILTTHPV